MMLTARKLIKLFRMKPLPNEGGFYTETYRCKEKIQLKTLGSRNISTAILYLLTSNSCSKLHRLKHDEIFHFYLGDPVTMLQLHSDGKTEIITLGPDILKNQSVQVIVPRNTWQGCFLKKGGKFALLGTTVAPGFDFKDFQLGDRNNLLKKFPARSLAKIPECLLP
jgi:predicted cupin superfamily sugar epimerase